MDEFRTLGCSPEVKISFDGVGTHDWMRKHPGAEKGAPRRGSGNDSASKAGDSMPEAAKTAG